MLPNDRALREELRREAAQVRIPDDMWDNISRKLDADRAVTERRNVQRSILQRKSALALVAAAGIFWIMAMPVDVVDTHMQPSDPFVASSPAALRMQDTVPWEDITKGPAKTVHNVDDRDSDPHPLQEQVTPR